MVVLSPSLQGGSWRWIEEVVDACGEQLQRRSIVVAYGRRRMRSAVFRHIVWLPFISYERVGLWMSNHPMLLPVYNTPLVFVSQVLLWLLRPKVVLANGVLLAMTAAPYARLTGAKLYLAYHSYAGHYPGWFRWVVTVLLRQVDCGFANSVGSERDLAALLGAGRVLRIEHWADDVYFQQPTRRPCRSDLFTVLYVGRLDEEKVGFLLRVIRACENDPIRFLFAGTGPLAPDVERLAATQHVYSHGYVFDKQRLAQLYASADVVWAVADDTYLAKPGVEALAVGTPLIVPDVPAVHVRAAAGVRVPHDLIPSAVASVIDGHDVAAARALLLRLIESRPDQSMECRAFAQACYSRANVLPLVRLLSEAVGTRP
ncbi:MAG: glycosyltransferase [Chloroflexi bacterium]|nr:glycosyltransferase [Chloroflexota bacterium]